MMNERSCSHIYDKFNPRSNVTSSFPNLILPLSVLLLLELLVASSVSMLRPEASPFSISLIGDVLFIGSSPIITRTLSGNWSATEIS